MDIYIYSDESGVLDYIHNKIFVFGGVVFLNKDDRDITSRKYSAAEKILRKSENVPFNVEVKATTISNFGKGKLYRSLNSTYKFGVIVHQKLLLKNIFDNKKSKQRYLDYAYKIGIKRFFEYLINTHVIIPSDVHRLHFYVDEHTTATDGYYELRESLEQEFRFGTFNWDYNKFFPPIFPHLLDVKVNYCNSSSKVLVRAADIVANRIFYLAHGENKINFANSNNLFVSQLP